MLELEKIRVMVRVMVRFKVKDLPLDRALVMIPLDRLRMGMHDKLRRRGESCGKMGVGGFRCLRTCLRAENK